MPDTSVIQAKLVVPSKLENLAGIRDLVESTATQAGFGPQEVQRIVTAAFEAVTNAVAHGSPQGELNSISVDLHVYPDRLVIEVADQGSGFTDFKPNDMPDTTSRRGRGVPLMRALVDDVEFLTEGGGKVRLTMYREM